MQFSAWPSPGHSTDEILDIARFADRAGWYGVWFADHYMPNSDDGEVVDGDTHEAWAMLAAIAMATERVRVGPLVSPTTVHHPAILANRAATIDHLSGGRFVLGIGAGWQVNEHRAYGIDLPGPGVRVSRFEEAIQIVRSLSTQPRTTFDGEHYRITDAPAQPAPLQTRLPILVGSGSPRMMRITARFADEWNTWGDLALAEERATMFLAACDAVGRDPGSVHRSVQAMVFFAENDEHAAKLRARAPEGRSLVGSAAEIVDAIGRYVELGFGEFNVLDATLGRDTAARADGLARFDSEVAAHFRHDGG